MWRKCSVRSAILELVDIMEVKEINKLGVINTYLNESSLFNLSYSITSLICVRDRQSVAMSTIDKEICLRHICTRGPQGSALVRLGCGRDFVNITFPGSICVMVLS